jgi:hypothetical protein
MKKTAGDRWCSAIIAASELLTQLISNAFSLSFYTIFSHPVSPPKPYGLRTCLIMMQHIPFSPNLYTIA